MLAELPRVVAVTGGSGYLGSLLLRRLLASAEVERVVCLDLRPPALSEDSRLLFLESDVRRPFASALAHARPDALVHLAYPLNHLRSRAEIDRYGVEATRDVLAAAEEVGCAHVVMCSSSTVYGGYPDNPVPLGEESPLRPNPGYLYAEGKRDAEFLTLAWAAEHPATAVSVVRPCIVLGGQTDNYMLPAFERTEKIVRGTDPCLQFMHEDDFADAMLAILRSRSRGVFNVAPDDYVRRSELFELFGLAVSEASFDELRAELFESWQAGAEGAASPEVLALRSYSWAADNAKLKRVTAFQPRHTSLSAALDNFQALRRRRRRASRRIQHD